MQVSGRAARNVTVPSSVAGQFAADPLQDGLAKSVPPPEALWGLADHVIPEIRESPSSSIIAGNPGQVKSSRRGATAALETNRSGIAEALVGAGEGATGVDADDEWLISVDVVVAECVFDLEPGDLPPHAARRSPANKTTSIPPAGRNFGVGCSPRCLSRTRGGGVGADRSSGLLASLVAKPSLLDCRGRTGRKTPGRFISGSFPAVPTAVWLLAAAPCRGGYLICLATRRDESGGRPDGTAPSRSTGHGDWRHI